MAKIETNIDYIKEELKDNKAQNVVILNKLDCFIETNNKRFEEQAKTNDSKYATKNVEKVVYALIGMILVAFVYALFEFVFKG